MGQYFKAALIDNEGKVKVVNPSGWKLMEHSWYGNSSMERIEKLLYREAKNVYWIGDYSIMADFVWKHKFPDEEDKLWDYKGESYNEDDLLKRNLGEDYFLVNHNTKEFINMTRQENNEDFQNGYKRVVHPLPLLTRAETEEAGGGYYSEINREYIGIWCGDIISISSGKKEEMEEAYKQRGYKDMSGIYYFKEEY